MRITGNRIHFKTLQNVFKEKYGHEIEERTFANQLTGELHNLIVRKGTDVALLSKKPDEEYVCLDTYGQPVPKEKIIAYTDLIYVELENGVPVYSESELTLYDNGNKISLKDFTEREKMLYPERTGITFEADYREDQFTTKKVMCYVDDIVYVSKKEFERIMHGENSDVLAAYNEKTYKPVPEGCEHGILILTQDERGIFVNTDGYDYARHYAFDMKLGEKLQTAIAQEMKKHVSLEIKLYLPMRVIESEDGTIENEIDGCEHYDAIQEAAEKASDCLTERGLADYLRDENLKAKVFSITPDIDIVEEKIMGVVTIQLVKPLEHYELDELKNYCSGQFTDGWGESSSFDGIRTDGTHLYVCFMEKSEDTVMTEEELLNQSKGQAHGMQSIDVM